MDKKPIDLCKYRIQSSLETLEAAKLCIDTSHYRDAINRCYYAVFYAVKAVLALEEIDFKKHKDVVAYFNKNYVRTEIFSKDVGKKLSELQKTREESDYDDYVVVTLNETQLQYEIAGYIINEIQKYLSSIIT